MAETLNTLSIGNLQLLQAQDGYRFSLDPVLLARFATVKRNDKIVDLGTGSGILPLLLAQSTAVAAVVGLELQEPLVLLAAKNVELNSMQETVTIKQVDIRNIRNVLPAAETNLVVSNPPYRRVETGRIAPNDERAAARHELAGGLQDFVAAAQWLLKHGGRFAIVYLAERLPELFVTMSAAGIEPKRLRMVHSRQGDGAKLVLLEGRKGGRPGLQVETPIYIYRSEGSEREYSEELLQMYALD